MGLPDSVLGLLQMMMAHFGRNQHNKCPDHPPGNMCDGRTWKQDPDWVSTTEGHPGVNKWRGSDGSECAYDKNGNEIKSLETYNFVPNSSNPWHLLLDVLPEFLFGTAATPG